MLSTAKRLDRVYERAAKFHGLPVAIHTDKGPEFTGKALDQWAYRNGVKLKLIASGTRARSKATIYDIWRFTEICRVTNVMRPFLESVG